MENKEKQETLNCEVVDKKELPLVMQLDKGLTENIVARAEKEVEFVNKLKVLSIKVTNYLDWVDQQGKPYLQNSGCMKIAQLFGINFLDRDISCETVTDDKGTYKIYTCQGKAEFHGREVEDIGTCSTRDDFLGKKGGEYKALEDVDLTDIKKKAVTNWQNRVLKKILGLAFTWEDLAEARIDRSKISEIKYANGGAGGGIISEPQQKRMFAIMKEHKVDEGVFKTYLTMNFGYTEGHTKNIKRQDYEKICTWLNNGGK